MKLLLVVFLLALTSCSRFHSAPSQDARLLPYFTDYYKYCTAFKSETFCQDIFQIDLEFATISLPSEAEGTCRKWNDGGTFDSYVYRSISIDPIMWRQLSETERHILVYHELGHCHLDRQHLDTKGGPGLPSYVPSSIMNTYRIQGSFFEYYHAQYLEELFNIR